MFCQNCGTRNNDDAIFCENCGARLERGPEPGPAPIQGNPAPAQRANPVPVQRKQPKKPFPVLLVVWIAEAVVLIAVLIGAYSIGSSGFGPEKTALNYFINIANGDWEKAYEKLDVEESGFINARMFAEANQYNDFEVINNYEVAKQPAGLFQEEESSLGRTVTINYRTKGDNEDRYYRVDLSRQPQNQYLLFDNWKVGTGNLISRDFSIYVPRGASVTVDGVLLDESYLIPAEMGDIRQESYIIPQIFSGFHTITVSMEDMEEVTETVQISYDNDSYNVWNMKIKDEVLEELIHTAAADMQQIYQAALSGKTFKTIESIFTGNEADLEEIRASYEVLMSGMNEGSQVPVQIRFYDIMGYSDPYIGEVEISFEYQVDYTYEDWWSGERKSDVYNGSTSCYFHFASENGAWVLLDLGCGSLYY